MNKRAIIVVLDSFGIGALKDAAQFGDEGSNTLGHIDQYCYQHNLNFNIDNLLKLGLGHAYTQLNHHRLYCDKVDYECIGFWGAASELSSGKDTTSGHWEIAGCPVLFNWGYFKDQELSFPPELLKNILTQTEIKGYLGNCHASGTEIIEKLGLEHLITGYPIFYTSADSVFQIAAHESSFGLERLYNLCLKVRELLAPYNIARVIARPFTGDAPKNFIRTSNRKDYSLLPHSKTLFDNLTDESGTTISIGKIADIYAHRNTGIEIKATGIKDLCTQTMAAMKKYKTDKTFIMTNLVDFDMNYGHRRDILGYKNALEEFDILLVAILNQLEVDDLLILTADHGCDPSAKGSDHTREYIPIIGCYSLLKGNIGIRSTFADIGQSVAQHLGLSALNYGTSFNDK